MKSKYAEFIVPEDIIINKPFSSYIGILLTETEKCIADFLPVKLSENVKSELTLIFSDLMANSLTNKTLELKTLAGENIKIYFSLEHENIQKNFCFMLKITPSLSIDNMVSVQPLTNVTWSSSSTGTIEYPIKYTHQIKMTPVTPANTWGIKWDFPDSSFLASARYDQKNKTIELYVDIADTTLKVPLISFEEFKNKIKTCYSEINPEELTENHQKYLLLQQLDILDIDEENEIIQDICEDNTATIDIETFIEEAWNNLIRDIRREE